MARAATFYGTAVGKKVVMAVSGAILIAFVCGHLLGNLQIFLGPAPLNRYAAFLKSIGEILWAVRAVLALCALVHVIAAVQVTLGNWRARPVPYAARKNLETTFAAGTMVWSGPALFLYIAYHLMMFTFLTTGPGYSPTDVYRNEVLAFRVPAISGVYVLAMVMLGLHLYHGFWSMLQTLGGEFSRDRRRAAAVLAVLVTLGYISIPVAILAGVVS